MSVSGHAGHVRRYLAAIEAGEDVRPFFTADAVQVEYPNRLTPNGATRDMAALAAAQERGKAVIRTQRFVIAGIVAEGERVAVEAEWHATLAVAVGNTPAGGEMVAHFAMVFDFRDGLIARQRNYDCFPPF